MIKQLKDILEIITKFNNTLYLKKEIKKNLLEEQQKNIHDLEDLLKGISTEIKNINEKKCLNKDDWTSFIALTHSNLMTLCWHIEEIDELLRTFSKLLPKQPQS